MHKEYIVEGVEVIHIQEYANRVHLNQATVRNMLARQDKGTVAGTRFRRPLKYIRDDSTVWIPLSEVTEYPFIKGTNCYHYNPITQEKELCIECTMGNGCSRTKDSV